MQYPNLLKRVIPFALALVLGLFIASFFVTLKPSFRDRGFRNFKHRCDKMSRVEAENQRLREKIEVLERLNWETRNLDLNIEEHELPLVDAPARQNLKKKADGIGRGTAYAPAVREFSAPAER